MAKEECKGFYYSKIDVAYNCYRKYYLQFIEKVPIDFPGSADLEFGTAMHAALQGYLEGNDGLKIFKLYWDSIGEQKLMYGRFNWQQLKDTGEKQLERFVRLHMKHFEPYKLEERLYGTIGGEHFEGTADFIGNYKGVPSIVDWKTSRDKYPASKLQVSEQMYGYAHLAKQCLDYDVKQLVYMVFVKWDGSIQKPMVLELTKEKLESMIANIEIMINDLKTRTEWPANRNSCLKGQYKCDMFRICYGDNK